MAYTNTNYPTKAALKRAVSSGTQVTLWSPGPFPPATDGREYVEGPWAPKPHRWYAEVHLTNGIVTNVK